MRLKLTLMSEENIELPIHYNGYIRGLYSFKRAYEELKLFAVGSIICTEKSGTLNKGKVKSG